MRCVILDDYQDVARSYADWSVLPDVDVEAVHEHVADQDRLRARSLGDAEVVVVMRERTPLPRCAARAAARPAADGDRPAAATPSIDLAAAEDLGIVVARHREHARTRRSS